MSTSSSSAVRRGSTASGEVLELEPRVGFPQPVVERGQQPGLGLVMLVLDLADDLLDHILDRHQALGAAEFVDDDGEMGALGAHPGEQIDARPSIPGTNSGLRISAGMRPVAARRRRSP